MHEMLRTLVLLEPLKGNTPQSTALANKVASLKPPLRVYRALEGITKGLVLGVSPLLQAKASTFRVL